MSKQLVRGIDNISRTLGRISCSFGLSDKLPAEMQANMEERVALAGGKERFAELLDTFFGFNGESVEQLTYIGAGTDIDAKNYHRFEGFNNESDMEAPFAYIYAGRHDRLCEIIHEAVTHTFTTGRGALPGNNDSGGLTSMYVWLVLGIFPAAGKGEFLIGAPHIDHAVLSLHNGNTFEIRVNNSSCGSNYLVDKVYFGGTEIIDYRIAASRLMQGGVLDFFMKQALTVPLT